MLKFQPRFREIRGKVRKSGNRDIFKSYTSHCRYKGKFHKQLYQRRLTEFAALFP